jgi:formylmethanofuran dehydrogenase subunit E-like metal-binding protein
MRKLIWEIALIGILAGGNINFAFATKSLDAYAKWQTIGKIAAERSLRLMKKISKAPQKEDLIVLTNAGYAEVNGSPTQGALDGLVLATGAGRGNNTLVEIHTTPWVPLWFAIYDRKSGYCAYKEVSSSESFARMTADQAIASAGLFTVESIERIDAAHLRQHASDYKSKLDSKIFGGNEFRIVTIANAVAAGAPPSVIRALEFHDHYCPGITSGILMTLYLKKHFPPGKSSYFIYAVDPWCKEDAFMVLLGTTPGKGNYAVNYPTDADKVRRVPAAKNAATIVYRQDEKTKRWSGQVLAFEWAETPCPKTSDGVIEKLCIDLWYLERMSKHEQFVKVINKFELPDGISPADWARPGIDPLKMLGLVQ